MQKVLPSNPGTGSRMADRAVSEIPGWVAMAKSELPILPGLDGESQGLWLSKTMEHVGEANNRLIFDFCWRQ
jgi:hypothetical protein